jgi:quercetin dioxygenase-like cupin family protein
LPTQSFIKSSEDKWLTYDFLPGVELLPLAEPVPKGSIHRARLKKGTTIPVHTHPADEYVYIIKGESKQVKQNVV